MCTFIKGNVTNSLACLFSFLSGIFISSETLMRFDWFMKIGKEINQNLPDNDNFKDVYDEKFIAQNEAAIKEKAVKELKTLLDTMSDDELLSYMPVLMSIKQVKRTHSRVMKEIDLPFPVRLTQPIKAQALFKSLSSLVSVPALTMSDVNRLPGAFAGCKTNVFDASFCADLEKVCTCVSDADFAFDNKKQAIHDLILAASEISPENAGKVHLALQILSNRNRYARLIEAAIEELFFIGAHPDSRENFADHMAQYICTVDDTQLASVKYGVPEEFRRVKKLFL